MRLPLKDILTQIQRITIALVLAASLTGRGKKGKPAPARAGDRHQIVLRRPRSRVRVQPPGPSRETRRFRGVRDG